MGFCQIGFVILKPLIIAEKVAREILIGVAKQTEKSNLLLVSNKKRGKSHTFRKYLNRSSQRERRLERLLVPGNGLGACSASSVGSCVVFYRRRVLTPCFAAGSPAKN